MISDGPALHRLARFVNGHAFKPQDLEGVRHPVIRIKQLLDPGVEIDRTDLDLPNARIEDGDLIFSWSATLAVRRWNRGRALLNQHLFRVETFPTVDPRWFEYVLTVACWRLSELMHGSAMTHITRDMLRLVRVRLPELSQQRTIADFLDSETDRIDALIAKKRKMIELLDERTLRQVDALVLGEDLTGTRAARSALFAAVPHQWLETSINHLGCLVQTGPFGSQLHSSEYVEGGWPVVNPANLVDGVIQPVPTMTITDEKRTFLKRHILQEGDIVFGRRGEMGRAGLVEKEQIGWLCGTGSLRLRLDDSPLQPRYLKSLLESTPLRRYFETESVGSTMDNLNSEILLRMPCLVPPTSEQRRVTKRVAEIEDSSGALSSRLTRQIDLLAERRQALITAAVTGELQVAHEIAEEAS